MSDQQKGSPGGKSLIFHGGIPLDLGASALSCQGFVVGMCLFFLRTGAEGMKRKNESHRVTVEDFYRWCLQGTKPRLGQVASKRGSRSRMRPPARR